MVSSLSRVVCVEDDPDIRELIRISLGDLGGLEVGAYSSGLEAIQRAPAFEPDLILLDVMMPLMTGPETMTVLRKMPTLRDTPMVFMTAKVQHQEVASYYGMGATAVISKPFDPITLADEVRTIYQRSLARGAA